MALQIFDCITNISDDEKVSVQGTSFDFKFANYDSIIYESISTYFTNIYSIAADFQDSNNEELKSYADEIINKYNDFFNNTKYYQKYFLNYFNENLGAMIAPNDKAYWDIKKKLNKVEYDFKSNFIEYYLMVKQTEKYVCTYKEAYDKLINFYTYYGNNASFLCVFDKAVLNFQKNLNDLYDWIITNNISENNTIEENSKQTLENAYQSLSSYETYFDTLNSEILNNGYTLMELFSSIEFFMTEVKLALKIIAAGNVIMTSNENDVDKLNKMAQSMLSYNPDNISNYYTDEDFIIINKMTIDKIKIAVPIFVQYRKYLNPDWSNFQSIMIQSVQMALGSCNLYQSAEIIINALPEFSQENQEV
jgi:hypothetical protein